MSLPPSTTTGLSFKVHRRQPELVTPAKPTPRELKLLSDIDDQQGLRFQIPVIFFYRPNLTSNQDPVQVIRRALAETLVYYYPFAGRLWELSNRKLAVDCTGEGVLFIEAEADVTLAELEEADGLLPPFPCLEELLFDVEGSSEVFNTPLLLVQVSPRVLACFSRDYLLCYLKRVGSRLLFRKERNRILLDSRAGHALDMRWIYLRPPFQPHHDRWSRPVAFPKITVRVSVWAPRALGSACLGPTFVDRECFGGACDPYAP